MNEMRSFTIDINEDVIKNSEPNSNHNCMVANALRDQLNAWSVVVDATAIRFNVGGEKARGDFSPGTRYMWPTPSELAVKITEFDGYPNGEVAAANMDPFKIRLQAAQGFCKAVKQGKPHKKKPHEVKTQRPRAATPFKCTKRRYHGKNIIEVVAR